MDASSLFNSIIKTSLFVNKCFCLFPVLCARNLARKDLFSELHLQVVFAKTLSSSSNLMLFMLQDYQIHLPRLVLMALVNASVPKHPRPLLILNGINILICEYLPSV